jgi:cell division protein FtsL
MEQRYARGQPSNDKEIGIMPDWPGWGSLSAVSRIHNWAEIAGIVFLALLVVAETITWKYGNRKDSLTEQQQTAEKQQHDEEMARLHLETAQAQERAAQAQLELEKYKAPRALTTEQQRGIENALKPFAGQEYALSVAPGEEPASFLCLLDGILTRAGWKQHAVIGSVTVGTDCGTAALNSLTGIDARRSPNASPASIAAINALVDALANTDAAARGRTDPVNNSTGDVIVLMVGAKS